MLKKSLLFFVSYGLAWSPHKSNSSHLLSAGFDGRICQWDVDGSAKENRVLEPVRMYTAHTAGVEVSIKQRLSFLLQQLTINEGCRMAYKI